MKYLTIFQSMSKTVCSTLLCAGVLSASFSAQAADPMSAEVISPWQAPLSLTLGVAPNLLVTLDDSGSMVRDYAPDLLNWNDVVSEAFRSNAFNSMYYNPETTYVIPKQFVFENNQIVAKATYTTTFAKAKKDGFLSSSGTVNLANEGAYYYNYEPELSCPVSPQKSRDDNPRCWKTETKKECTGPWYNQVCKDVTTHQYISFSCPIGPAINDKRCYEKTNIETQAEKQNFANWYSFYRTRKLATQSAAILAFSTMPDNVRLTWGALQKCHLGDESAQKTCNNKMAEFTKQHRANFFNWIETFTVNGGTPLHEAMHRAGDFLMNKDTDESVCRASYHVLMTDGMWNGRTASSHKDDADSTAIAKLPDGQPYAPRVPFSDGHKDTWTTDNTSYISSYSTGRTLADSAFYYWATDLRPKLDNKIVPYMPQKKGNDTDNYWDPRNNPATWQHMVNFTVGLGLSNALVKDTAPTWDSTVENPTYANMDELLSMGPSGKKWPSVRNDNVHLNNSRPYVDQSSPDNVYDLWHAAINSRGEFFSADSPDTLVAAFKTILERISGRSTTGSSPTVNSGVGDDGTGYAFQASYDADKNWSGNLTAVKKTLGSNDTVTSASAWPNGDAGTQLGLKAPASRNIKMAVIKNGKLQLEEFKWENLSTAQKGYLNTDPDKPNNPAANGELRVEFLRGDRSEEGKTLGRVRTSVLGDIVNSKPVTVRGARYLIEQANRIEGTTSYKTFVTAQSSKTPMVYVGANDGMLHGFNANTGEETFAFVPTAVFGNLNKLTSKIYGEAQHQFFVDGSPVVADVYINQQWRTVLVGTLGAGGKGMFALDVTDPSDIKLLWEFNEDKLAEKAANLGYTFAQPTIARLHNGKWAAVVGNGYSANNSGTGTAALLIIDMETGELTKDLVVHGTEGVANGMSTPKLADINGDGIADYAYAGDLQGNVWRFDLAPDNKDASNPFMRKTTIGANEKVDFQVSFGNDGTVPLFSAVTKVGNKNISQPITAAPSIVRHPTGNGYIIVVGTGRYYIQTDKEGLKESSQSLYGIWDPTTKVARSTDKSGFPVESPTREHLHAQVMESTIITAENGKPARQLSNNPVPWAEKSISSWVTSKKNEKLKVGWYFDLVLNKEMIVADMVQFGKTLYFQSLLPDADPCAAGVENWSYAIDPATGGSTSFHAWTDYRVKDDANSIFTAVKMGGEGGLSIGQRPDSKFELCTGAECNEITPDPASIGRQSWRVIDGL